MTMLRRLLLGMGVFSLLALFASLPAYAAQSAPAVAIAIDPVEDEIDSLKDDVVFLVLEGVLTPSQGLALMRLLDSALLRYNQGRDAAAVQLLRSFQAYVIKYDNAGLFDDFEEDEELEQGIGEYLWDYAQDIIDLILGVQPQ